MAGKSEKGEKIEDDVNVEVGLCSKFRRKLVSVCRGKLYSFQDLSKILRAIAQSLNDEVKHRRLNLSDGFGLIPFARNESFRTMIARSIGQSTAKLCSELKTSDWQRNPRYRKTLFLENLANIIEENCGKDPHELCEAIFNCESEFYAEDFSCGDGVLVDYRGFLKEIGFFELFREAITFEFLEDDPTIVLALTALFGRKALSVIGLIK